MPKKDVNQIILEEVDLFAEGLNPKQLVNALMYLQEDMKLLDDKDQKGFGIEAAKTAAENMPTDDLAAVDEDAAPATVAAPVETEKAEAIPTDGDDLF